MADFTTNLKKYFLPALLLATVAVWVFKPTADSVTQVSRKIQARLNNAETLFYNVSRDTLLLNKLAEGEQNNVRLDELDARDIYLYYYKKDSLVHWTSNSVLPLVNFSGIEEGTSFLKLKNGWYQCMKVRDSIKHEILIGLTAVKYQYPFENKFLQNDFAVGFNVPHRIEISDQKIPGSVPIKDLKGQTLFSLYEAGDEKGEDINLLLLLAQVVLLLIVFYYVWYLASRWVGSKGFLPAFILFTASLFLIRAAMLVFDEPFEFVKLDLFSPRYYASSFLTKSLGDLIINCIVVFSISVFGAFYSRKDIAGKKQSKLVTWGMLGTVFVFTGLVTWVFKTLVMDSVISFEVYNVLSLNYYSLLGMICVALLLASHFLLVKYVVTQLHSIQANTMLVVGLSVIGGLVSALFAIHSNFYHIILFASVWAPFCIIVLFFILKTDAPPTVRELIIYIALYSILSVFLIENLYERKERNQRMFFASRLVTERDFVAEFMFNDIAQRISGDPFIRNFFNSPISPRREVTARLSSLYLSGYFNKYELKVYAFDKHDLPIKNHDTLSLSYFNDKVKSDSFKYNTLYYINDTVQSYSYYSFIRFTDDSAYAGTLVLHLIPKVYYGQNVYPELLLGENVTLLEGESKYNYAIYKRDKLIIQHGDFPYTYYWSKDYNFEGKQYVFIDAGDWEHIIYRFSNDMKVIVTEKHEGLFEPVATFSYLFSFYFLAAVCMLLFARLFLGKTPLTQVLEGFTISFRTRINYSMLLMIVISFIIIGFITISFFSRQYDNFYSDRLLRKEKVLHASLEYFIQQNITGDENLLSDRLSNALNFEVARLSEINDIDINLYDKQGNLEVASQPGIYDKGLVSKKMNPDAYFELVNSKGAQVTEQENVGGLKYLATYAPIRDSKGDAIAYLGIPYFERSKNINDEVSSFLVALMNVYVFLLICAAILAYFISNSITRPLTIISEKLRILNLNKKNEPIEWKSKDEIGVLIGEYNKMINELEQSAYKLARSERESAWREMAKQIAHEIKNPLTPMKLSIQYLQRAIDDGHPNINELAKKVTRTLEEQIENLSSIATAFSSFAKMPKPQNEIIDMNSLLKSIADLFNREEKATITFTTDSAEPLVFADKNQLVSVFNNLVKNAIQSIPENRTGFIDIHIKEDGEWIMASVHDNGSGIPKDLYEKVFVPNFTTKSSGTGLGLAISKQIIEGAGGQIWFESAENVGTSFFVKLKKGSAV